MGRRRSKDETYWRVLNAAITLDIRYGHTRWTVAQLARSSEVSRTLIYYYFGKSKLDILNEAVELFGSELSAASPGKRKLWEQGLFAESLYETRQIVSKVPAMLPFYLLNRQLDTEIGKAIRSREAIFRSNIERIFPTWSAVDQEAVFAVFFGVAFAPEISEEGLVTGKLPLWPSLMVGRSPTFGFPRVRERRQPRFSGALPLLHPAVGS